MSNLIFPEKTSLQEGHIVSLIPVDLAKEDSALLELLRQQGEHEAVIAQRADSTWYRAGFGPTPNQGGIWVSGTTLVPLGGQTPSGTVNSILCTYDRYSWLGWQNQISLRLYITNANQTLAWTAPLDITSGSTTVSAAGVSIPANCRITLQIKVGNITGGLYQPPYISSYDCTVSYS
ncbi:TPA: hypothetical protein VDU60_003959 [Pseudomonas aeruginosa]|nr:hypothetical protein [Pseudomonas aeruginosa]